MCRPDKVPKLKRSNTWWKRSLAVRTVAFVDAEVETLTANCRFLQQQQNEMEGPCNRHTIAKFHRREIEVGELIGQGAFSEVYAVTAFQMDDADHDDDQTVSRQQLEATAVDGETGQCRYVIKHLKSDLLSNRTKFHQAAADLVLEASYLLSMDHENIIKLRAMSIGGTSSYGDGQHDGYFLVLDHLDMDLAHRIQQWRGEKDAAKSSTQKFSNTAMQHYGEKLNYGAQIASALTYLHERGIMYRDLKPENIGLKGNTIQLFDFGLCRELPEPDANTDKVFHMSGCGTRRYMSPQVALGLCYNLKADVYSFAVVLYEMMSLERPYDLYNREMHQYLVCEGGQRPTISPEWPISLQDILRSGWAQEPSDRPSMKQVYETLQNMLDHTVQVPEKSTGHPIIKNTLFFKFMKACRTSLTEMTSTTTSSFLDYPWSNE